ncbi:MAG: mevalonate kinase [Bacteroidota bacterium]|jgi:mevalonate kinase|nr:mevalonate kinase [Bacteroidota bacterium]|tara:strand:- start:4439 stop:5359 length:921 start_codon:yes stop_codon:yes gene_type:complete
MKGPLFYSKILLFGEYGIIEDSKGLSIPYNFYKGALKIPKKINASSKSSNKILIDFLEYLNSKKIKLDLHKFRSDLDKGLYFDSSIPKGYGIGSSGALVAAIYDKYAFDKITVLENLTREKLLRLKNIFSIMESFFHGKSSGLDPLNSYLSIPILINSQKDIKVTGIPSQKTIGNGAVFLMDSGKTGSTAPMVNIFMEKMKKDGFRKIINEKFIKHTNLCVDNFLKGDLKSLFNNTKKLSKIVLDNFKPMIPKEFHNLWKKGIENNSYFLKLCGSGGGGYILGFTENFEKAKKQLKDHKLEVVYYF